MGDNKQWFKVWTCILTDPGMEDLHNDTIGAWVRLGALVAQHGEKGIITLSPQQLKRKLHLYTADDATINVTIGKLQKLNIDLKTCNEGYIVTFKKWYKYQVDNSTPRVQECRKNVTMQEEKRREEKREEENKKRKEKKTEEDTPLFISKLKENPAYKNIDVDRELAKMDAWLLLPKSKGRKKTKKFILNWLNNIDVEVTTTPVKQESPYATGLGEKIKKLRLEAENG